MTAAESPGAGQAFGSEHQQEAGDRGLGHEREFEGDHARRSHAPARVAQVGFLLKHFWGERFEIETIEVTPRKNR